MIRDTAAILVAMGTNDFYACGLYKLSLNMFVVMCLMRFAPIFWIYDERGWKRAAMFCAGVPKENTASIIVSLIKAGIINVAQADALENDWETNHRFRLKFTSFGDVT
jgi:hypothetical protein